MVLTEAGRRIEWRRLQPQNASSSIARRCERGSNQMDRSGEEKNPPQIEKQLSPMTSTDAGTRIDLSNSDSEKAESSIRRSLGEASNWTA
jgi:hypothetical protein